MGMDDTKPTYRAVRTSPTDDKSKQSNADTQIQCGGPDRECRKANKLRSDKRRADERTADTGVTTACDNIQSATIAQRIENKQTRSSG